MLVENDIEQVYLMGDLHLGVRQNSISWSDIQEKYLLETFVQQVLDNHVYTSKRILILEGDIFHSRQAIDVRIFNRALEIFGKLSCLFRKIYIILGNHDVYYREDNSINSVEILSKLYKNIVVLEEPDTLVVNNDHKFLMLPWIESVNKITEVVESHVGKCQYIVCHADIRSAKFNKFQAEDKGMDPKVLKAFKRVYSGHIHLRQEIKKNGANVLYTGTPYAMDANDVDNQKGFDILSFVDGEIVEKFVPNTDSPIFVKKNLYTILEMSKDEIHSLIRNNFVNIQVDNRIVNRFSVQVFMELIKDMECRKIEFTPYSVTQKMDTKGIVQAATDSDIDLSIPNMMNLYLDQKGYDRAMRKKVESKFNEFLAKVKENQKTD